MSKNRVRLNIAGSIYTILSEENENYVRSVGDEIDKKINQIKKSSTDISSLMAAILTAMDFCDLYKKSIENQRDLENKNKNYYSMNENLRTENNTLKIKIDSLEKKLNAMSIKNNGKIWNILWI